MLFATKGDLSTVVKYNVLFNFLFKNCYFLKQKLHITNLIIYV